MSASVHTRPSSQQIGGPASEGRLYAVILAGGQGTRLWPRSRQSRPKQFVDITGQGRTMLQETVDRLSPVIPMDQVLVITGERYAQIVREQLPYLPPHNLLVEPSGRNTAPAIGLALVHLARRDPNGVMVALPADHAIADGDGFRRALRAAERVARQGYLVTLGIEPDHPHTGYGYIQRGEPLPGADDDEAYVVTSFHEKPDKDTASRFLEEGGYYWNGGIFIFGLTTMLAEMRRQLPELLTVLQEIAGCLGSAEETDTVAQSWGRAPSISIDYGVMEHAESVAVVPMDIGWNDVGDWAALRQILRADADGNIVIAGDHVAIDSRNTVIYGADNRLIVTVGVEDLVIVQEDDVLLVCPCAKAQDIKWVVERLQQKQRDTYL